MATEEMKDKEDEKPESELLRIQRENYEKIIADKNKIIADLLNNANKDLKENKREEDEDEDEDEKKKKDFEERRKKRLAFYKKNIF